MSAYGRRRFGSRERAALYLAADGKCSSCGRDLGPGWHADHVTPWSRGGQTDVINGQALCPECNLRKGNTVSELRAWQDDALRRFVQSDGNFLAVACPGAGKTTFALAAAQRQIEMGSAQRIIVVVPTKHLRKQWAKAARGIGIQLDWTFVNGAGVLAGDFDGVVVTYDAVSSQPLLYRKMAAGALVILDEVHHGGENLTWGDALKTAFEPAARRLLLSGTPTRTDHAPVPFVHYDDQGRFVADGGHGITYDYGTAIQDHAVRPIEFLALEGNVRWREAGMIITVGLKDTDDDTIAHALDAAYAADGDWIKSVLRKADQELTRHREAVPDAGGLVVAADQYRARQYAAILKSLTGDDPAIAISDEPDSSDRISDFARGTSRWIVAVQMVSEGVDIPRLAVGVYASKIRTAMFFRQVVGRFVRMRGSDDETTATLLVPSVEPLLGYAREIEKTVNDALREEEKKVQRQLKERDESRQLTFDLVEPAGSSEAVHTSTILSGDEYSDEELKRAENAGKAAGMPSNVSAAQVAKLLRMAGAGRVVGTATVTADVPVPDLAQEKASLRRLASRNVGRLHRLTGKPHQHINADLNRLHGAPDTATADALNARLQTLDAWIAQAKA